MEIGLVGVIAVQLKGNWQEGEKYHTIGTKLGQGLLN